MNIRTLSTRLAVKFPLCIWFEEQTPLGWTTQHRGMMTSPNRSQFLSAYLLSAVNVLGYSILIPVLPFVVEDYGAPEWVYGLMLSVYSFCQLLGRRGWGNYPIPSVEKEFFWFRILEYFVAGLSLVEPTFSQLNPMF